MADLVLTACSTYPPALFHQDLGVCKSPKEFQPLIPSQEIRRDIIRSGNLHLRSLQLEESWKPISQFLESSRSVKLDSVSRGPVLVDVQESRSDSVLFSFGIAEQCSKHEKILQFLKSGSNEAKTVGLDSLILSDLMGLQTLEIQMNPQLNSPSDKGFSHYEVGSEEAHPFLLPRMEFHEQKYLLDFVGDLIRSSTITVRPDGRVLLTGTGAEIKDILSVVTEFYLSMSTTKWRKQQMLVPHFTIVERNDVQPYILESSLKLENAMATPLKSLEKVKLKPPQRKKHGRKAVRERDLYRKNYFHACESLLSVMVDKRRGKTAILSLKKSGPEVAQLLTQCSAGIAGTGLAVLFSVICKVSGGKVPFCTSKLLNTGFGFGLFWLSWAVNTLRDTIVYMGKNSSKVGLKEDKEMLQRVNRSVNEIFFRAAALMAVAVLRFA